MISGLEKKLDEIVSIYVRARADWKCIVCRRRYMPVRGRNGLPRQNMLTASHYFNRWKRSVRWDLDNLDSVCIFCHTAIENSKNDPVNGFVYKKYMIEKLGIMEFEMLRIKSTKVKIFNDSDYEKMYNDFYSKVKALK